MGSKNYYLTPYFVRSSKGENLDSLKGKYDLLLELYDELSAIQDSGETKNYDEFNKTMKVREVYLEEKQRLLYGIIDYGEYGKEQQVVNTEDGSITHQVGREEAVVNPFYFCFYIPYDSKEGVLLSQKTGNIGIKTVIYNFCKEVFYSKFPVYFYPLILKEVMESMFSRPLMRIRFVKYKVPKDIADSLGSSDYELAYEEVHIVAKRNRVLDFPFLEKLKDAIIQEETVRFAEILPIEKDSNEIKLEFKLDGNKKRTLRIKNEVTFRSDFPVYVEIGDDGHPTLDSIHSEAIDLLSLIKSTVFGIET